MIPTPSEIEGRRVLIRRIQAGDADPIVRLISDKEVVRWTIQIPHPYPADGAMKFIRTCQRKWRRGEAFVFAETLKENREFLGVISLSNVALKHGCAELGFWTGQSYWGKGFTTEAVGLTLRFAFEVAAQNTLAEGARLDIMEVPVRAWCSHCKQLVDLEEDYGACPLCAGNELRLETGQELKIKTLEVV